MTQFMHWLMMGGYSIYVWPAYGVVFTLLVANLLGIKWQKKRTRKKIQQWFDQ
jgi:heme exporter protein D